MNHYYDKKSRDREEILEGIEYHAMLVSINPKGVAKVIAGRKRMAGMEKNKSKDNYLTVNENGENEYGQKINTTFFADLKKYGGEEALAGFENTEDYRIETDKDDSLDDDDEKFIKEAKKLYAERELELIQEAKFKEEHPELFDADEIIF